MIASALQKTPNTFAWVLIRKPHNPTRWNWIFCNSFLCEPERWSTSTHSTHKIWVAWFVTTLYAYEYKSRPSARDTDACSGFFPSTTLWSASFSLLSHRNGRVSSFLYSRTSHQPPFGQISSNTNLCWKHVQKKYGGAHVAQSLNTNNSKWDTKCICGCICRRNKMNHNMKYLHIIYGPNPLTASHRMHSDSFFFVMSSTRSAWQRMH